MDPKRKDTINKSWLNYINQLPIKIIYNKPLQLLISPLFHSKFSLDVNGHIILANNSQLLRNIPRLPTFTESKITDFSQYLLNNLFKGKCSLEISELKNPYVLFYARSGEWIHSVKNSRRNMPKDLGILILKNIISMGFKVVLIGDTPKEYLFDTSNIFHVKKFSSDLLCSIYSNATAVIGSGSGAIHFPSFIFNLPTLSFTCKPLYHLDAMYMPPLSDSPFSEKIPFKDKWIIASDLSSKKLMNDTKVLIEYFLSKQNLKNISGELKNPFKYIYTNINSKKSRFLSRSKRPNILIY